MKYLYLIAWFLIISGGVFFHTMLPSNFWYITGFVLGSFCPILLKLYDIENEKEGK